MFAKKYINEAKAMVCTFKYVGNGIYECTDFHIGKDGKRQFWGKTRMSKANIEKHIKFYDLKEAD